MKKPLFTVLLVFSLIILGGVVYTVYMTLTLKDESTSIGIPFAFLGVTGLGLFFASIILTIVFVKRLQNIWPLLLSTFVLTGMIPAWFIYHWWSDRPVSVPTAGPLPVAVDKYNSDIKLVLEDYMEYDLDSINVNITRDTIISEEIDTIFYSPDKLKFFAIIIAVAKNGNNLKYCSVYRVGRQNSEYYEIGVPRGNIWATCFQSKSALKTDLRQYYYKRYSINGSSDRPEIWLDQYIFSFEKQRDKYIDRKKNAL